MSQLSTLQQKEREQALFDQKEQELYGTKLFRPRDIPAIWNSNEPKQYVTGKVLKYINNETQNPSGLGQEANYQWNEFEMRFEEDDVQWMADFNIHNIVYCIDDLKLRDNEFICQTVNAMFEYTLPYGSSSLQDHLRASFELKKVTRDQIKQILEYMRRTYVKHKLLYQICSQKQPQVDKEITLYQPEPQIATNLATQCQEIIEHVPVDQEALRRQAESQSQLSKMGQQEGEQPEFDDEVDPENPLYGLEERLRNMNLDEESLRIVKDKLMNANHKIKNALEDRQKNLDSKLGEKQGAKKK